MAAFLMGPLISTVKEKASSYLLNQYKVMEGMEEQREILERKLPAIQDVILDAEEKGAYRPGVRAWLDALKKVAYEAIDVFDEFKYEALRRDAMKKGQYRKLGMDIVSLFPAHNPIVFRYRMTKKLCKIVNKIEILVAEMNTFGFQHLQQAPPSKQWRQTDSIMPDVEKDIVSRSRGEEKTKIVKILLEQAGNSDLLVLPTVGMGGLGKTTFAQLIYNDPEIENHFELRRWCCVSDDFDVATIATNISQTHKDNREKALQDLQKAVSEKRFLIVLDDVWNEDADKWEKLKTCLMHGGKGSAILTTTRKAQVAQIMKMGVDESHYLGKLEKVFLKEIFENRAFCLQKPNFAKLNDMVEKIVERCSGSPLAAKAFGSIMSTKPSMKEWKNVLAKSNICNEKTGILPILKLSYDDLPSHLKQCFCFCAIFPKDYEIDVETLIQLWMAHDFIPLQDEDNIENVGQEIFKELAWRSFFQDVNQSRPAKMWIVARKETRYRATCKMHDLMHDIALSVMGKECVTIVDRLNHKLSGSTRHLSSSQDWGTILDDSLKKQSPALRTMLCLEYTCSSPSNLSDYSSLRALQLKGLLLSYLRLRHLQHLRYLNLSHSYIRELPEEISMLYNIQTLNLSHCEKLVRLPMGMKYMTSLRHLYTYGCKSLKFMPSHLGQLTSLQSLTYFVVGTSPDCSTVEELHKLNLGGELVLYGLENVTEAQAKLANIGNKEKLTHLSFEWSGDSLEEPRPDCHKKVLDAFRPHGGLLMLRIVSYKSTVLPTWMTDLSLMQHLTDMHLNDCTMCEEFPQFYCLKALQVLHLEGLTELRCLCSNKASAPFPALEKLKLIRLCNLEKWVANEGREEEPLVLPLLENVEINDCPKLTSLPEAPKLKVVRIDEEKAEISLSIIRSRYMSSLSKLKISVRDREGAPVLHLDQPCEASISEISLSSCDLFFPSSPSQPTIGIWKWFGQLVHLRICSSNRLIYWPEEEFRSLLSLKHLSISECNKLVGPSQEKGEQNRARNQVLPHLNSLDILSCPSLTELFILSESVRSISICHCISLEFIVKEEVESNSAEARLLDALTSSEHDNDFASTSMLEQSPSPRNCCLPCLESIYIQGDFPKLVAVPYLPPCCKLIEIESCDEIRSISGQLDGLTRLDIQSCNKLESLDFSGDLPSLELFYLRGCRSLASLPGGLISSPLVSLTVKYCPSINMKPLYQRGQQWLEGIEYKDLSRAGASNPDGDCVWVRLKDFSWA